MGEVYRSAKTQADFIPADVSVIAGQFVRLGSYTVKAGEVISVGYGAQSAQNEAQGRIFAKMMNTAGTPAELRGTIRLSVYSPLDRPIEIICEFRTEQLNTDPVNRTLQIPFPEDQAWISRDKKLVLEFNSDTTDTLSHTNSAFRMDTTQGVV